MNLYHGLYWLTLNIYKTTSSPANTKLALIKIQEQENEHNINLDIT